VTGADAEERPDEGGPEEIYEADGVNPEDVSGTKLAGNKRRARTKKENPRFSGPLWIN
jgi:hypothetical protein